MMTPYSTRPGRGMLDWGAVLIPSRLTAAAVVAWFEAQIVAMPPLHFRSEPSAHSISRDEPEV